MKDIDTRADLEKLLAAFYDELLADSRVNYIFTDVAKIDINAHLPHIVNFWEQSLFGRGQYRNNVLEIHRQLNYKEKLTEQHFEVWIGHFNAVIDRMFIGENAEKAKTRALSIATIMRIKVQNQEQ